MVVLDVNMFKVMKPMRLVRVAVLLGLSFCSSVAFLSYSAFAEGKSAVTSLSKGDTKFKIGAKIDLYFGTLNQEAAIADLNLGSSSGLVADSKLKLSFDRLGSDELKYGAYVELYANPSKSEYGADYPANNMYVYVEGKQGKLVLGTEDGAEQALKVGPVKLARATGGIDGKWGAWVRPGCYKNGTNNPVISTNELFITGPWLPGYTSFGKHANKVTYYPKEYKGIRVGVSYTPISNVSGTVWSVLNGKNQRYRDVLTGALSYGGGVSDGFNWATSFTGQVGSSSNVIYATTNSGTTTSTGVTREPLRAYEIGGKVGYKNVAFAASYGDQGKSGTLRSSNNPSVVSTTNLIPDGMKRDGHYVTLGTSYVFGKCGASLNYLNGKRAGGVVKDSSGSFIGYGSSANNASKGKDNSSKLFVVGIDYQLIPGVLPYIEVTRFRFSSPISDVQRNKGTLFLAGAKIEF